MLIIKTNEEHPFECFELTQRGTPRMNPFKISFTNYQRKKIFFKMPTYCEGDGWEEADLLDIHVTTDCQNLFKNKKQSSNKMRYFHLEKSIIIWDNNDSAEKLLEKITTSAENKNYFEFSFPVFAKIIEKKVILIIILYLEETMKRDDTWKNTRTTVYKFTTRFLIHILHVCTRMCPRILWKLIPFICNKTQLLTDAHKDATEGTN